MTVAITCAGCRRSLRVPEGQVGQTIRCPLCIETFVAEADPNQPPPAQKSPPRKLVVATLADDTVVATAEPDAVPSNEPLADAPTRPTKPFKTVPFGVVFLHDPDRLLRGRVEAELTLDGLRVRLRSRHALWVPVLGPHPARYLGGNRLAVFLDGREVTVALVKERTDLNRLARDVADFLNGRRAAIKGRAYALPWKLTLMPWLALAVPFLAIWLRVLGGIHGGGRFLWFLVAGVAVLCGIKFMRRESLSTGRRVAVAGMAAGCCFLLLAGAFGYRLLHPNTVPSEAWRQFAPPGQGCRLLMPGVPQQSLQQVANVLNTVVHTVMVNEPEKTFSLSIGTVERNPMVQGDRDLLEACRRDLEREVLGYRYGKSEVVVLKSGEVGVQVEMTLTGYIARGHRGTQISRLFLSGDQLYVLSVSGEDVDTDDPDVKKFFGSFLLGKPTAPPSPGDLPGVITYWSFENLVHRDPPGTLYDNVGHAQGVRGRAASLNGAGAYVNFDNAPGLNFADNQPFSFVGWVKTPPNREGCILSMHGGIKDRASLELRLTDGRLWATLIPNDEGERKEAWIPLGTDWPNDGGWHHVALTRSGQGALTLYLDGIAASSQHDIRLAGALTTTARSFGCNRFADFNVVSSLPGDLDEVAFFNRCLSTDEVVRLSGPE